DLACALDSGVRAGHHAAAALGRQSDHDISWHTEPMLAGNILPLWTTATGRDIARGPKQFVDLQNDVSVSDIYLAVREGYRSVEHVKRYTAMGFGTDQGKLGNINGMAVL